MSQRTANFFPSTGQMVTLGSVRASWPVAADVIKAGGQTANWLLSRGTPLVVDGGHSWTGGSGPQSRTLHYRFQVDNIHHSLGMTLVVSTSRVCVITVGSTEYVVGFFPAIIHIPLPNAVGNGEISLATPFGWSAEATDFLQVHSVCVFECPQVLLEESGTSRVEPRQQIYDAWDERSSIAGLARAVEDLRATYFRRGALFNWTRGNPAGAHTSDPVTYQSIFPIGFKPALQQRLMYTGETTRAAKCNVYARTTSGGHGLVKLEMTNGDSVVFDVTNSSDAWQTTQTIDIATDNPSTWDSAAGIRGIGRDELDVSIRAFDGDSGDVTLYAVSIWDPPG